MYIFMNNNQLKFVTNLFSRPIVYQSFYVFGCWVPL